MPAIVATFLPPAADARAQPRLPWVAENVCPGETCRLGRSVVLERLELRAGPSDSAAVVARLDPGDTASIEVGEMHVSKPGRAVPSDSVKLFSADGGSRWVPPGDTLFVLHYSSEGLFRVWHEGGVFLVPWFWDDPMMGAPRAEGPRGTLVERGRRTWWLRVRVRDEAGWLEHRAGALEPVETGT